VFERIPQFLCLLRLPGRLKPPYRFVRLPPQFTEAIIQAFFRTHKVFVFSPSISTKGQKMQTLTELPTIALYYREGSSDKVYQCQIKAAGERFTVDFAYGRRGSTLNQATKTNVPVDLQSAQRIFDKLVREKKAKGYREGESGTPYQHTEKQPSGLLPQLLNSIDESQVLTLMDDENWCAQEKFDGRRLIIRKAGNEINGINKKGNLVGLPEPLFQIIAGYGADVVLDGETVGNVYHAFDLLNLDGLEIRSWPYRERLAALLNLLFGMQQTVIKFVETAFTPTQKVVLLEKLKTTNREGIVFKQVHSPYTAGRPNSGGSQLKHKFVATLSAVVAKVNRQRSVELQLLGPDGWASSGNVTIPSNQKIPAAGQVVEVRYLYAFRESGVLYQPVYLGPRDDVDDSECQTSQLKFKPQEDSE
jgi:bifunctional non-homologous end joining protein LigD